MRGCQAKSRRFVDGSQNDIRNKLDFDKLDHCSEVSLGLLVVAGLTAVIWMIAIPVFDVAGMGWVRGWEKFRQHWSGPPIALWDFKQRMFSVYPDHNRAFSSMDRDQDTFADFSEFVAGVKTFGPPLDSTQARYAFELLDGNKDNLVGIVEFEAGLAYDNFEHVALNETSMTTSTSATPRVDVSTTRLRYSSTSSSGPSLRARQHHHHTGITMKILKARFPEKLRVSARSSFGFIDRDSDQYISRDEMQNAAMDLRPPLIPEEADDAFDRLDTNADGRVESLEFFMSFEAGAFLNGAQGTRALFTLREYQHRQGVAVHAQKVTIRVPNVDLDKVTTKDVSKLRRDLTGDLAQLSGRRVGEISDQNGNRGQVSVSRVTSEHGKIALVVDCEMRVPDGESYEDAATVLQTSASASYIASRLKTSLPGQTISRKDVVVSVEVSPPAIFKKADANEDGMLSKSEFERASEHFTPLFTPTEAAFAFKGLDVNDDGLLSPAQFLGIGYSSIDATRSNRGPRSSTGSTMKPPWAQTTLAEPAPSPSPLPAQEMKGRISLPEVKTRMDAAFPSAEDAFIACDTDSHNSLLFEEFVDCVKLFRPVLSDENVKYVFKGLDLNGNGDISHTEFFDVLSTGKFFPNKGELERVRSGEPSITMEDFKNRLRAAQKAEEARRLLEEDSDFDRLDRDHNHELSLDEFRAADTFRPNLSQDQAAFVFKQFDLDLDGMVTLDEFSRGMQMETFENAASNKADPYMTFGALKRVFDINSPTPSRIFDRVDFDGDGRAGHAEFVRGCLRAGLTARQASDTFHVADRDQNGWVSEAEFFEILNLDAAMDSPLQPPRTQFAPLRLATPVHKSAVISMNALKARMSGTSPQDAFLKMDGDGDGFMGASDFGGTAALTVFHPALTPEQASYVFDGFDANRDNYVCISEFFGALRLGAFHQTPESLHAIGAIVKTKVPSVADQSNLPPGGPAPEKNDSASAPITEVEFLKRINRGTIEDVFASIDENKNAEIDRDEYIRLAAFQFTPPLNQKEVVYTFKGMDSDGDGSITAREWFGIFKIGHFFRSPQEVLEAERQILPNPPPTTSTSTEPPPPYSLSAPLPSSSAHGPVSLDQEGKWQSPIKLEMFVESMRHKFASPQQAFGTMDRSGKKLLVFDDFVSGVKAFVPPLDDTQAMYAFKGFDVNTDHLISEAEFRGSLTLDHFFQSPQAIKDAFAVLQKKDHGYDCQEDLTNWDLGWSDGKKKWCCNHAPSFQPHCKEMREQDAKKLTAIGFLQRLNEGQDAYHIFADLDINKDGFLVLSELQHNSDRFHPELTDEEAEVALKGFDSNLDSRIVENELDRAFKAGRFYSVGEDGHKVNVWKAPQKPMTLGVFTHRMHSSYSSPDTTFSALDSNMDGQAELHEFIDGTATFLVPLANDEAQYAFEGFDVDGNGKIDRQEFEGTFKVGRFYPTLAALRNAGVMIKNPSPNANAPTTTALTTTTKPPMVPRPPSPIAATTTTTLGPQWELHKAPLTLPEFQQRMGDKIPSPLKMLSSQAGGCAKLEDFQASTDSFDPPLTDEEVNYAFCGMDEDHDKKVCSYEFFAIMKIGHFFPARSHMEHLKEVGAIQRDPENEQGDDFSKRSEILVSKTHMKSYGGVPATVNGHAEITLYLHVGTSVPGRNEQEEIGMLFKDALRKELNLQVTVDDVATFRIDRAAGAKISTVDTTLEVLWSAAPVEDGGSLQGALRRNSAKIEGAVRDAIIAKNYPWMKNVSVWIQVSLSFYGPQAPALPDGPQISQDIGHEPGEESENDTPAFVSKQ